MVLRADGTILSYNERFVVQWGVPAHVLERKSLRGLVAWLRPGDGDSNSDGDIDGHHVLAELLTSAAPPPTGEILFACGRAVAYRSVLPRGGDVRVWAFFDTSGARHVASGLREAANLLRLFDAHANGIIFEVAPDASVIGIWARDPSSYFEESDILLQGRPITESLGGPSGSELGACIRQVFEDGQGRDLELARTIRGARRVFAVEVRAMPTYEDESPRVTVMIHDVTDARRLHAKLLETERLASVGLLAAGVAHEVNNPLAYTLLNLERIKTGLRDLAEDAPSPSLTQLIEATRMCIEGARRVHSIVNDLRRFSRSDEGEPHVSLDVHHVLDFALDMSGHQIAPRAKLVRAFGDVPCVMASEGRLGQVFLNLLVNAAQAIAPGAPDENEIRVVTGTDERGWAVIEVSDTGVGMSAATKEHIFEPFFTTKHGEGTGLGLAICQGIVLALGGQITVESEPGCGATFRLLLPSADASSPHGTSDRFPLLVGSGRVLA